MKRRLLLPVLLALTACVPVSDADMASRTRIAESTLPPMKSFAARAPRPTPLSNQALVQDFLELSFEMESGSLLPALTRFEEPITLRVTGDPPATLVPDLQRLLQRLKSEAGIDIATVTGNAAHITIEAVSRDDIRRVLPQAACFVAPNVSSLAEFRKARRHPRTNWATLQKRERLVIVIPNDVSPQEVRDCLHEELAQAIGPLNDLYRLPNSVFNDDNVHTVLTHFDMLILKATYAPELASGMDRADVAARLPAIFARINPGGNFAGERADTPTPQAYVEAIQAALGPGADLSVRRTAADEALRIAQKAGWTGPRRGFAHYARARVLQATDAVAAHDEFLRADAIYAKSRKTRLHRAYVSTQLAAHALSAGDPAGARSLVTPYIPLAEESQNAALLATLQLLQAEALLAEGRVREANALRLDSLGWARYGFGADWAVQTKLREISSLGAEAPPV
jgi:hypothetical protein